MFHSCRSIYFYMTFFHITPGMNFIFNIHFLQKFLLTVQLYYICPEKRKKQPNYSSSILIFTTMPEKKKQELKDRPPIVAAYLRVSTDKQTILNQKSEVINFCRRQDLKITTWCTETVSGTKKESERLLGTLLKKLQKGDTLIITEVSRLSRKMMNIMNIIHQSIEKGITIYSIKEGYKFDSSINSQVLAFAFGLCAEIERTLISQRTREALARRRAQGVKLGRPKGSIRAGKLFEHEEEIRELRTEGISFQKIAMRYKVSPETVRLFYLRTLLKKNKKLPEEIEEPEA